MSRFFLAISAISTRAPDRIAATRLAKRLSGEGAWSIMLSPVRWGIHLSHNKHYLVARLFRLPPGVVRTQENLRSGGIKSTVWPLAPACGPGWPLAPVCTLG